MSTPGLHTHTPPGSRVTAELFQWLSSNSHTLTRTQTLFGKSVSMDVTSALHMLKYRDGLDVH